MVDQPVRDDDLILNIVSMKLSISHDFGRADILKLCVWFFFFFQAEDGIRDRDG